jgi:hypothetical protein
MILPFIELICACGLMCVLIPWNGVVYLENDHYCFSSFTNIPGLLWGAFVIYIIPIWCLVIIYIRITRFIRQQSKNRTLAIKQRQDRDLLIIRRILIIFSLLLAFGFPTMVLIVMAIITGEVHPLTNCIVLISVSISMATLSVALLFSIPQLKSIVLKLWQSDRVTPFTGTVSISIQMRTIGGNN